jgi:hypothetical protein
MYPFSAAYTTAVLPSAGLCFLKMLQLALKKFLPAFFSAIFMQQLEVLHTSQSSSFIQQR